MKSKEIKKKFKENLTFIPSVEFFVVYCNEAKAMSSYQQPIY